MKKLLIAIILCLLPSFVFAESVQRKHLAVIAGKNAILDGIIGTLEKDDSVVGLSSGIFYYSIFQPTTAGTISYAHIYTTDGNAETICLSIQNSSGTNLAYGSAVMSDATSEWINISLNQSVNLSATTDYFLSVQVSGSAIFERDNTGNIYRKTSYTYDCGGNVTGAGVWSAGNQMTVYFNNIEGSPE